MTIAENIVALRTSRHFKQAEFARVAGISLTALRHYEAGERVPSVLMAQKMADALGVTVQRLLLIEEPEAPVIEPAGSEGDLSEIIKLLTTLNSQQLKLLLIFLKALTQDSQN